MQRQIQVLKHLKLLLEERRLFKNLQRGGKIVASAYILVHLYDYVNWQRQLYNLDLTGLFLGVEPDIAAYSDRVVTSAPFSTGVTLETYNVYYASYPDDLYFHYFWKIETPPAPRRWILDSNKQV